MNIAFYTGVSGMIASQKDMDTTAHNMANIKTAGFKAGRSSFEELMYSEMNTRVQPDNLTGHGVKNVNTNIAMQQAGLLSTGYALDFAIVGEGYFGIQRDDGVTEYTRNGTFNIGMDGKSGYLVASDGGYVLDNKGKPIKLDIDSNNKLDTTGLADKLGVYKFSNPYGLERRNGSSFVETEISGSPKLAREGSNNAQSHEIVQHALENSNVELGDEMINVIQSQRAFQFNSKMVKAADEIEEIINNLR